MFGDMGKMMKQVMDMKKQMGEVEKELKNTVIKGISKNGFIEVEITGKMKLKNIALKDGFPTDKKQLENSIFEAVEGAMSQVSNLAQEKLKGVTGGVNIPGLT